MTVLQAVISGLIQGITEFFPVSSSGHLVLLHSIFGLEEAQLAFDIFLHLATVTSVIVYFRKDIIKLLTKDRRILFLLILASVPTAAIGFLLKDLIEPLFQMPVFTGYMLVATGMALTGAHFYSKDSWTKKELSPKSSLIIGIAQGIAVMPGISRSGATISAGLLCGLDGTSAARYSFLLSIPAILGASLMKMRKITEGVSGSDAAVYAAGGLTAFLVGLFAISALLKIIKAERLYLFGIYCIVVGLFAIIFLR